MNFPVVWQVGGVEVAAHTVFEAAGYVVGFQTYLALKRRTGDVVGATTRWVVIAAAAVGAALGAKAVYWLDDPAATWAHRGDVLWLLGGKTIVGGILGGWAAVEAVKRWMGVTTRTGDLFAAPLCVGIAVGRIGCFLAGLGDRTYGFPTSLPWGVDFGDGVARHPTQLYETAFCLVLGAVLAGRVLRPHREGAVFRAFVAAYLAWRLAIDFAKPGPTIAGMSGIQWACLVGLTAVLMTHRSPVATPPAAHEEPARG